MLMLQDDYQSYFDYVDNKICSYIELKKWDKILMPHKIQWLSNFTTDIERYLAYRILDKFIYYSDREVQVLTKRLICLLFRKLEADFKINNLFTPSRNDISSYLRDTFNMSLFTYITGEISNPCDSGYLMCRYYRDAGIPEEKIIFHNDIFHYIMVGYKCFVLVDDLIGSGTQAVTFWKHPQKMNSYGKKISLEEISNIYKDVKFFYLALAASESGIENIRTNAPNLEVIVSEKFTSSYGIFSENSFCWTNSDERSKAKSLYNDIVNRVGIDQEYRDGFGKLELAIAFSHGIPDNTLPILWWDENGWKPLIRRPK